MRALLTGAYAACQGENTDRAALGEAAIAVMENPPEDEQLAALADHLCRKVFDFCRWGAPRLRLQNVARGYVIAALALEADRLGRY